MRKITKIENNSLSLPKKLRVAAYARVSAESERLLHSLSAQVSYYSELIQKNPSWEYAGVYADSGISGTSTKGREEFKRLIQDCESGKIDIILVKSISRFARNTVDLLETIRRLKDLGIDVRFEKENINSLSADGEIMISVLAAFAQDESRTMSENIKWGIRKNFEKGKIWHTAAFGYRWNGETFEVDENEAAAVRKIFDDFLKVVPLGKTSKWLKENGFSAVTKTFIHYALQNEVYTGDKILQKYYSPKIRRFKKNEGEMPKYHISDSHPAIIDRAVFEKVQEKIKESYDFNPSAHRIVKPSCFSSKLKCGVCGESYFKGLTKTNSADGLVEHWICFGKNKKGTNCGAKNIRGDRLREVCRKVLGLDEFDEYVFSKSIEKIVTTQSNILKFYFYDGSIKEAEIHYFSIDEKKYTDPHSRFFGYCWSKSGYQIVDEEAKAVRLMYEYYADGCTISDISRLLTDKGYKTMRGKMSRKAVAMALDSELYIGKRILSGQFTKSGNDEAVEHPRIIDDELNARVKKRRQEEYEKRNGHTCGNQ